MEEALPIWDYLPLSFKSEEEQAYIAFLWDAFQSNYENGKYQFAFLAFHMLTMSYVYFNIWQIKNIFADKFRTALIGFSRDETDILKATSPFVFAKVQERTVFRFLRLIGCNDSQIGVYAKLVDDRNDVAHPNGKIVYNAQITLDQKVAKVLWLVAEIEKHSEPLILDCYETFLREGHDLEKREFIEPGDQIREALVHRNYFSKKDIEICMGYKIDRLAHEAHFEAMQALHSLLLETYSEE